MRLIIAAYWTEEVEPFMQWENGRKRWPTPIKGSGAQISMTPTQVEQPGLRDVLRRLCLEEAADWRSERPRTTEDECGYFDPS